MSKDLEAPPLTYQATNDPNAFPPSYDSIFGRVREVRQTSNGSLDFLKNIAALIIGTIGCTIAVGVILVIPLCMIIIGSIYLHNCPAEPYIPIYLIVGGVFSILKGLISRRSNEEDQVENLQPSPLDNVISCFLLAWFIAGCVWVYRIYEPNYVDTQSPQYCQKTVYLFAFWVLTSSFIFMGIAFCILFCLCIAASLLQSN